MANNTEQGNVTFTNSAPDDKEWTAHIELLNEWVTPDRYLRDIVGYIRSGKHYPKDMHVDLIMQWHEAEATRREQALLDELLQHIARNTNDDNTVYWLKGEINDFIVKRQLEGEQ